MASELALEKLNRIPAHSVVLDPMAGSGTVLRQAMNLGHQAIGFDMDPLAVLMSRVWTTPVDDSVVVDVARIVTSRVDALASEDVELHWMDNNAETTAFVNFWFAEPQKSDLRRIAYVLEQYGSEAITLQERQAIDVIRIAFSRLIITKSAGASLARDVSHSRPHKTANTNDFTVIPMFERSIQAVRKRLGESPSPLAASIDLGDARSLTRLTDGSVDTVLTSPPYLNAIDYMRGHRLSLVWLGYSLIDLRTIRSSSIGSERSPDHINPDTDLAAMRAAMGDIDMLPVRFARMVDRYVQDIHRMVKEVARVLRTDGQATFVVGNSCLRGVFIQNSAAVATAARLARLTPSGEIERMLPAQSRYLPMTSETLGKRMRTETVLSFIRP